MSQDFIGQMTLVAFNFANTGRAQCAGQLLPISQNTALFSLLGTFYGGDGKSTFALPNLQGNVPMGQGSGPGLSPRFMGEIGGSQNVTLLQTEMPQHSHFGNGAAQKADQSSPSAHVLADAVDSNGVGYSLYAAPPANDTMNAAAVSVTGNSQPHNNMMQYLVLNWLIALQGIFPSRA